MPRLKHTPPKYGLHKASGSAYVNFRGKRYYLGKYGSEGSKERYSAIVEKWKASPADAPHDNPKPPANVAQLRERRQARGGVYLNELLFVYLRHCDGYYRKDGKVTSEYGNIRRVLLKLSAMCPCAMMVHDFGPVSLAEFQTFAIDKTEWNRKGINKACERIRRAFKWGVANELVDSSIYQALLTVAPLKKGRSSAREASAVQAVSDSVINATLDCLSSIVGDMVRIQRLTGARPGEVCSLRPCDIDRSFDAWVFCPKDHKTEHHGIERRIFIGPKAQTILSRYLLRDPESHCFDPREAVAEMRDRRHDQRTTAEGQGNSVGSNRVAKPRTTANSCYSVSSYRRAIHRACDSAFPTADELTAADLKQWQSDHRWSPNQLRHTKATEIRKDYGLEAAQVVLGHASANITQVYAERDMRLAAKLALEVG